MKKYRKVFAVLAIVAFIAGCASAPIIRNDDCADSKIYDALDKVRVAPDVVSRFLLAADMVAMKEGVYTPEQALQGVYYIRSVLQSATYAEIYQMVVEHFPIVQQSKAGEYIVFLLPLVPQINIDKLISKCDQEIISAVLQDHEDMIKRQLASGK